MRRTGSGGSSRRRVGLVIAAVVLVGVGGWVAGTQLESPADAAASHQAPKAGPVTVAVTRQVLTATVVAQGSVAYGSPQNLTLAGDVASSGGDAASDGGTQRVTKAPVAGTQLTDGSVLMQVSGRPVMVLRGEVPMYRDLGPGTSGDDVRQLQTALTGLGFGTGGITGHYGQGTASAVSRWYRSKGYTAQEPSVADQQQMGQLEAAVTSAQQALLAAQDAGSSGAGKDGASGASGSAASRALVLRSAQQQLNLANSALNSFQSTYGTKIAAGELLFLPRLPLRVNAVKVHTGDTPDGTVATVTSSEVVVQSVVPSADADTLRVGMAVQLDAVDGTKVTGVIGSVGASATTGDAGDAGDAAAGKSAGGGSTVTADAGSDAAGDSSGATGGDAPADPSAPVPITVSVSNSAALAREAGSTVTLTVNVGSSKGKVLAVPVVAVHTTSDGEAHLQVQRSGKVVTVDVTVGISAAGLVEVTPLGGSTLSPSDQVVVGQ